MTDDLTQRAASLLDLKAAEYFAFDDEKAVKLQAALSTARGGPQMLLPGQIPSGPPVLAIGAPTTIDPALQRRLPLLVGSIRSGQRAWAVTHELNLLAVITDLQTGVIRSVRPLADFEREIDVEPSRSGDAPAASQAHATCCAVQAVDLLQFLAPVHAPAELAVTLVEYDCVSNTVLVRLEGEPSSIPALGPRHPSSFVHSVLDTDPPKAPGVVLSVPERIDTGDELRVEVKLALPVDRVAVAPSYERDDGVRVLVSLLLVGLDESPPQQIDIAAPAELRGAPGPDQLVVAAFGLRARVAGSVRRTLQVYLVCGDRVTGPRSLSVG